MRGQPLRLLVGLAAAQGAYYVVTGVWPLVHLPSFEAVTGPKASDWLVRTVGILILVIGGVLLLAAARLRVGLEVAVLGAGSALGLAVVDVVFVSQGVIGPVYLLDAAVELTLVVAWIILAWQCREAVFLWAGEIRPPSATAHPRLSRPR